MSTQTARAVGPGGEPMTPVIIKSGGGESGEGGGREQTSRASSQVEIDTDSLLPFVETALGLKWESSQSIKSGRIIGLTIDDGEERLVHNIHTPDELASVTLMYGLDQLMVMESGVPAQQDVVLVITSPQVPFDVPQEGQWASSTTTFPNQITSVALTVGTEVKLFHECKNPDVTVTINFDQNQNQNPN